jgi:DNA-binding transcriptional regulator YiaG
MTPAELKAWRTSRHITQAQAAELVGAGSYRTWQDWERGQRPMPKWLLKMLKLLDKEKRSF